MDATVWKTFTISDFMVMGLCLGVEMLIVFSDIAIGVKGFVAIFAMVPLATLFFPNGEGGRLYMNIVAGTTFMVAKKKFSGAEVKNFVPYTKIREDGLIYYPTYFSKVISVGQIEFSLLDEDMQNRKIAMFERILKLLDENSCLDIVKIDRPLILDNLSDALFERVKLATDPVKRAVLEARIEQIARTNNLDKLYRPFFYLVFYGASEKILLETVQLAVAHLEHCELGGKELNDKETVNFLKYCHTRYFDEREIDDVPVEKYAEYILPKTLEFNARSYKVDGINAFTFAIADYPLTVGNAWGAKLFNIDNTKVVLKIRPVEKDKAIRRIDKVVNELGSREDNTKKASEMITNAAHADTMNETLIALQNENEALFDCTFTITAFNNSNENLQSFRRSLRHKLISDGFKIAALQSEQLKAFLAANISRIRTLKRHERGINSSSLAAVFPFVTTSIVDEPNGIVLGLNEYPVALDITKRGGDYKNSNILILGQSGGGKSYFAKTLASNLYADDWRIYVFDVEKEFTKLCNSVGGSKIDVGSAMDGQINPWHIYGLLTDDGDAAPPESVFNNQLMALESFFKITLEGLAQTPDTLEYINTLVVETYAKKGITEQTDCSKFRPEQFPIFDDLMKIIKDKLKSKTETANPLNLANLQRAETYISKFAKGGRYSGLWNGVSSLHANRQFTVFNFLSLLANKNQVVANAQMLMVMRFIEQEIINTRDRNRVGGKIVRTLVLADEAHTFIDPKFPVALDFFYQMAKRIRKYAGALCFITQNLGDGMATEATRPKTAAIFANCQYSFIFQLPPTDLSALVDLYKLSGGINKTEQDEISSLPRGQCFLISAPRQRTSFDVVATEAVEDLFIRDDERQL